MCGNNNNNNINQQLLRSQQHSERSRGYILNNTNNVKPTIKTIPAVGVCSYLTFVRTIISSPTELLLMLFLITPTPLNYWFR